MTCKGIFFGIAMAMCSVSWGQDFHLGLTLSPNVGFSVPRQFSHESVKSSAHFGYGFIFDAKFTETYAIGTGINVFHTGGVISYFEANKMNEPSRVDRVELVQRLQYVELPLTFKMRTKEIGYTTYWGQFGLGLGLNVRAEGESRRVTVATLNDSTQNWESESSGAEVLGSPSDVSLVEQTRLFRPALIIGFGLERRFTGTTGVAIGIRYNMGIRNQYEDLSAVKGTKEGGVDFNIDDLTMNSMPQNVNMFGKSGQLELLIGLMF
jgi:hypothetical protein